MRRFYFAQTDDLGVDCVDQLDVGTWVDAEKLASELATSYPEVVYFAVEVEES